MKNVFVLTVVHTTDYYGVYTDVYTFSSIEKALGKKCSIIKDFLTDNEWEVNRDGDYYTNISRFGTIIEITITETIIDEYTIDYSEEE